MTQVRGTWAEKQLDLKEARGAPWGDLGKGVLGGVNGMCKDPEVGPRLACWKNREEACMAGAE